MVSSRHFYTFKIQIPLTVEFIDSFQERIFDLKTNKQNNYHANVIFKQHNFTFNNSNLIGNAYSLDQRLFLNFFCSVFGKYRNYLINALWHTLKFLIVLLLFSLNNINFFRNFIYTILSNDILVTFRCLALISSSLYIGMIIINVFSYLRNSYNL